MKFVLITLILVTLAKCTALSDDNNKSTVDQDSTRHKYTNRLINETSPYLLQHAHNPVDWHPWGEEALRRAKKENKLLIISIGYSACHWCHVMERESFEDKEVADFMNTHFINIKVDREERPDVDQVYMNAVQLMTNRGGWPLNCIALPDGGPVWGGTYFPKQAWLQNLKHIVQLYLQDSARFITYAERLTEGVQKSELITLNTDEADFTDDLLQDMVGPWMQRVDWVEGGGKGAPKFPMPNNYLFLLRYAFLASDQKVSDYVHLTLKKMAYGGIYDHIGGGFARYSTDRLWKVPHFEKMLYDNAQLVSLYAEAYQATQNPLYKKVVYETLSFIEDEMSGPDGEFYSALDADSEGEEGKFYVWTEAEIRHILKEGFDFFSDYYNVNAHGKWEHDNYILMRKDEDKEISEKYGIDITALNSRLATCKARLKLERDKRVKPGLDDKSLTSWNALMLKGYIDAYRVFGEDHFLQTALKNARFILSVQKQKDGRLNHSYKKGKSRINGYLEDYAFVIEAFIALYEATFDKQWIAEANQLMQYAITYFFDKSSGMFFFTSETDHPLIARKMELYDNVIPASNSSMAKNLFWLGHYYLNEVYINKSKQMLVNIKEMLRQSGSSFSNWGVLMLQFVKPYYEIALVGEHFMPIKNQLDKHYLPNCMYVGSGTEDEAPLLANRYISGKTQIYVCVDNVCKLPVENVDKALGLIRY